jgi:hypothetical protein
MPESVCPHCQAAIDPDQIRLAGQGACPFCGAELLSLCPEAAATASADGDETWADSPSRTLPPLPESSRISIVESTDDRLVIYIPGGGRHAAALGFFVLLWNGLLCIFTAVAVFGGLRDQGNNAPPMLGLIAFLGAFWAIGLGLAYFWLKLKYERTFLLLERHRLVIQKVLFNRKRVTETTLMPDSRAELVESYQQNDNPVYRIEVRGQTGAAKFGTSLGDKEKDWLVDRINEFLNVVKLPVVSAAGRAGNIPAGQRHDASGAAAVVPNSCPKCGAALIGSAINGTLTCSHCGAVARTEILVRGQVVEDARYQQLAPADLPWGTRIEIDEDSAETLEFHFPAVGKESLRWLVPLVAVPFGLAWCGGVVLFMVAAWNMRAGAGNRAFALLGLPFLAAGLIPLAIGWMAFRGRTTIRLTRELLSCRWHAANFGKTWSIPAQAIDAIRVETFLTVGQNPRVRRATNSPLRTDHGTSCVVHAGGRKLMLTFLQEESLPWQIASLLRTRLQILGCSLREP